MNFSSDSSGNIINPLSSQMSSDNYANKLQNNLVKAEVYIPYENFLPAFSAFDDYGFWEWVGVILCFPIWIINYLNLGIFIPYMWCLPV